MQCWPVEELAPFTLSFLGALPLTNLASRIDDSKAKVIVTASCGFEPGRTVEYEYKPLVDAAIKMASHKIDKSDLVSKNRSYGRT